MGLTSGTISSDMRYLRKRVVFIIISCDLEIVLLRWRTWVQKSRRDSPGCRLGKYISKDGIIFATNMMTVCVQNGFEEGPSTSDSRVINDCVVDVQSLVRLDHFGTNEVRKKFLSEKLESVVAGYIGVDVGIRNQKGAKYELSLKALKWRQGSYVQCIYRRGSQTP